MSTERKRYLWIAVTVAFATFMIRIDLSVVNVALPTISESFGIDMGEASQIMLYFLLFFASTMLSFGKISDRIGLRKVLIGGYCLFAAGSYLSGTSHEYFILIISRCVQGTGAAMLVTSAFAIIPKFLPREIMGWAFGIQVVGSMLGSVTGAPLGGALVKYLSWPYIFFINLPLAAIAIAVALWCIPVERIQGNEDAEGFDLPGMILSFSFLCALLFALSNGRKLGWLSPAIISCFVASSALLMLFILRETRCKAPLIETGLFGNLDFNLAMITSVAAFAVNSGVSFLMPFYLQYAKGLSVEKVGLVFLIFPLANLIAGPFAGKASDRINPHRMVALSMLIASPLAIVFAFTLYFPGLVHSIVFLLIMGIAYGLFYPPNNALVMSFAPEGHHGATSATYNTIRNVSLALGVCIFEITFSSAVPREISGIASGMVPANESLPGFRNAFMAGGLICLAGAIATVIILMRERASRR